MMKKRTLITITTTLLILVAGIWFWGFREKEKPEVLLTEKPRYGYISTSVTATGTVQPVDTVAVGTQVSGTIKRVLVDFNSVVKKGQLLAQLDQTILLAQVQQIEANLQQAQSNLTYQQENFNRQSQLYDAGAISRADYETAVNLYKSAKENVNSLSAQLGASQKNLSFSNIISPIDGTVLSRNISEGQTVAASFNTPTLFSIAKDLTKMQVRASVDEADIGNVKENERVSFTVDAFPDDMFTGTVEEIRLEPTVSSNVVTYTTIINTSNADMKLKPGMTANITIYTKEIANALLIPAASLRFTPDASLEKKIKQHQQLSITNKKWERSPGDHTRSNYNTDSTAGNNKTDSDSYKQAMLWIKVGDSLMQKNIQVGLNDDINVQVIKGLSTNDEIITGIDKREAQKDVARSSNRSPFMPPRRGQTTASSQKSNSK
jgi:HlyD family secretion protein